MTNRTFALVAADGHVAILRLQPDADLDQAVTKFGHVSFVPKQVHEIDEAAVPSDRSYRDAWSFNGKFGHDMGKAKSLHRAKIRRERERLLQAADIALMRAVETGADTKVIAAEKQRLRDAPADPRIDAAKTIEELKAAWPL